MNVPLRKRITSRGVDLIRRRVDERVDDVVEDDDFKRSLSLLLDELRPRVVVFESILVASSAMITTLAFGSKESSSMTIRTTKKRDHLPAVAEFNRRLAAALLLELLKMALARRNMKKNNDRVQSYARDVTRPPRLNFFPFNTRAGTIGTDD